MARRLTHLDRRGRARMVDVSTKAVTQREAVARGEVVMRPETLARIASGSLPKGDVLGVARLAGIMAAKRTADLVPLCHPLPLSHVRPPRRALSHAPDRPQAGPRKPGACRTPVDLLGSDRLGARGRGAGRARRGAHGERTVRRRGILQSAHADRGAGADARG